MNRNKVYAKNKENQMLIKALNMFGRVPEQYELLEEIERLKIIEEKYKDSQLYIHDFKEEIEKLNNIINKALEKINDYKIYCENNKGFTEYTDIEIEAIEPVISKLEDILKEVSE